MSWTDAYRVTERVLVDRGAWKPGEVLAVALEQLVVDVTGEGGVTVTNPGKVRKSGATVIVALADQEHSWPAQLEQVLQDGRVTVHLHGIGDRAVAVPVGMIR